MAAEGEWDQHGGVVSEVVEAAHVLSRLGLVTAFGHVSVRAEGSMLITPAADLGTVSERDLVRVPLEAEATAPPAGAPAEAWAHLATYRIRPDIAAVVRAQPQAAFAVGAATSELTPLNGQAAWLGASVPVHHSAHLLRSAARAEDALATLRDAEALLLRGNGAITLGATPGVAVARMWLLSVACEVWLAAGPARTALTAEEIKSWRSVQDELLPRLWQHLRSRDRECSDAEGV